MADDPVRALIRTQLANERTFLAWLRSGLTAVALGVAAAHLLEEDPVLGVPVNRLLAIVLTVFGGLLVLIGRWRYRQSAAEIASGSYRPHSRLLELAAVASMGVIAVAIVVVLHPWS